LDYVGKPLCPGLFNEMSSSGFPFKLAHMGCNIMSGDYFMGPCDDYLSAHKAYQQWCAPFHCVVMEKKSVLQQVTGTLGMLGGLWSILVLIAFTILWTVMNAVIQWHHRKTELQRYAEGVSLLQLQHAAAEVDAHSMYALQQQVHALQQQVDALSGAAAAAATARIYK
jgi:hypothetical protein